MQSMIHERVKAARVGTNPTVVTRVPSGWVVMADTQYVPGYCILLPDPVVPDLNSLDKERRMQFLKDMVIIGDGLLEVTEAYRINYEIQGNTVPILHAHIIPRYMIEPDELRKMPIWFYETKNISLQRFDLERDKPLMQKIENAVNRRL
jgi:diadenosine tetraphosphate (Ap4A) HIT family hydrolase